MPFVVLYSGRSRAARMALAVIFLKSSSLMFYAYILRSEKNSAVFTTASRPT